MLAGRTSARAWPKRSTEPGPCGPRPQSDIPQGQHGDAEAPILRHRSRRSDQHIGLVAQLAAEPRVALAPWFEVSRDRIEQTGFGRRLLLDGRPAEEAGAEL